MAKYTPKKQFMCNYCGFSFSSKITLRDHKASHRKDHQYSCCRCLELFPTEIDLSRTGFNLVRNDEESSTETELTSNTEESQIENNLTRNGEESKTEIELDRNGDDYASVYDCDSCDLSFRRKQNLIQHKKMNHCAKGPALRCGDCDRSFRDSRDLHRHMERIHKDKKEFVCKRCGKNFTVGEDLLNHASACVEEVEIDPLSAVTVVHEDPETIAESETTVEGKEGEEGIEDLSSVEVKEEELTDTGSQFEHFVTEDPEDPFNYAATKILIDGIQKRYSMMTSMSKKPTVYREMAEELSSCGYNIPVHEVRKKWCNIVSYFWSLQNRADSKDWEFFEQLSSFLDMETQAHVSPAGDEFDHNSTTALIESVRKRYDALMNTVSRNRTTVYQEICEEVNSYGYNFDVQKLRRKWNNLLAQYKRVKKMTHATEVWEFFEQMNDFVDPGSNGPVIIEAQSKKVQRTPLSPPASPGSPGSQESETASSKKLMRVTPVTIKTEEAAVQSSRRDYRGSVPSTQPKRLLGQSSPTPTSPKKIAATPSEAKVEIQPHPLVIPHSDVSSGNSLSVNENDLSSPINGMSKRLALLEDYIFSLKQKENEERQYRIKKERRSRIKLRLLAKMGKQLEVIAKTQSEILSRQDKLLQALDKDVSDK